MIGTKTGSFENENFNKVIITKDDKTFESSFQQVVVQGRNDNHFPSKPKDPEMEIELENNDIYTFSGDTTNVTVKVPDDQNNATIDLNGYTVDRLNVQNGKITIQNGTVTQLSVDRSVSNILIDNARFVHHQCEGMLQQKAVEV